MIKRALASIFLSGAIIYTISMGYHMNKIEELRKKRIGYQVELALSNYELSESTNLFLNSAVKKRCSEMDKEKLNDLTKLIKNDERLKLEVERISDEIKEHQRKRLEFF